jgi:dienelactone hydrolase
MKRRLFTFLSLCLFSLGTASCGNNASTTTEKSDTTRIFAAIKEETVNYVFGDVTMNGYVAYDAGRSNQLPVILVVPEWWGLNDYVKMRARQLADLGYLATAVDLYGNGVVAHTPEEAQKLTAPFYADPHLCENAIRAALAKAMTLEKADTSRLAAIGYCFGGYVVLNAAKLGVPFNAVVSFHGGLGGVPPKKDSVTARFLICHGAADQFVTEKEVAAFKKQMDSAGILYTFKDYPNATHAFTNPASTETGKKFNIPITYNPAADTASWNDMKVFLREVLK